MLTSRGFILKRCFHTNSRLDSKPGKVLHKILYGTRKKKHYTFGETPMLPSVSSFGNTSLDAKITGNPRRSNMLNKLFMKYVTDIMSNGEYSSELLGYGIEVNRVKMSPDYKILNVFWVAKESHKSEEIDKLLQKNAGHLAHELSGLMLMGKVPTIMFVKDKSYNKIMDVQDKLSKADFGDDFQSTDIAENFKSELNILLTTFDKDLKKKINQVELKEKEIVQDNEFPAMPQNILGLDHAHILKKIKKKIDTSKAPHRAEAADWAKWSEFKSSQTINTDPVEFANLHERRKAFRNFLHQRQILQMKHHQSQGKNWSPDQEYLYEECCEKFQSLYQENEINDEDFILEDEGCKDVERDK